MAQRSHHKTFLEKYENFLNVMALFKPNYYHFKGIVRQMDAWTNGDETELTQPCCKPIAQYMNQPLLMK